MIKNKISKRYLPALKNLTLKKKRTKFLNEKLEPFKKNFLTVYNNNKIDLLHQYHNFFVTDLSSKEEKIVLKEKTLFFLKQYLAKKKKLMNVDLLKHSIQTTSLLAQQNNIKKNKKKVSRQIKKNINIIRRKRKWAKKTAIFKTRSKQKKWAFKHKRNLRARKPYFSKKSKLFLAKKEYFGYKLTIVVKANNVFCTITSLKENKILATCTAGKYQVKLSKKTIRYTYNAIITRFLKKAKRYSFKVTKKDKKAFRKERRKNKKAVPFIFTRKPTGGVIIDIVASARKRRKIIKNIRYNYRNVTLLIKVLEKKIFNGCRAPKKIRKKRRRMRVLK